MANGTMNPSTYQQVRENMERIADLFGSGDSSIEKILERLEAIEETVTNIVDPPSGSGDITTNIDGSLVVNGVTIQTQFADENLTPAAYTRDVTFELKKTSVVGLNSYTPFATRTYALVITYKHNLVEGEEVDLYNYAPQQIAYGDGMVGYTRTASDNTSQASWPSTWTPVVSESEAAPKQWIQSETEPENQSEGDYWCEPLS